MHEGAKGKHMIKNNMIKLIQYDSALRSSIDDNHIGASFHHEQRRYDHKCIIVSFLPLSKQ